MKVMELVFFLERKEFLFVNVLQSLCDTLIHVTNLPSLIFINPGEHRVCNISHYLEMQVILQLGC